MLHRRRQRADATTPTSWSSAPGSPDCPPHAGCTARVTPVVVLEARDRVGGRTLNHALPHGHNADLGGTWIGPTQTRIAALAKRYDVTSFPQPDDGQSVYYGHGTPADLRRHDTGHRHRATGPAHPPGHRHGDPAHRRDGDNGPAGQAVDRSQRAAVGQPDPRLMAA